MNVLSLCDSAFRIFPDVKNYLGPLVECIMYICKYIGLSPGEYDSRGLSRGPGICMFLSLPGDSDHPGSWARQV